MADTLDEEQKLTRSLSIALGKDLATVSEEELLDTMEEKLEYAGYLKSARQGEEAEYAEHTAEDIKHLLKLRIARLRAKK